MSSEGLHAPREELSQEARLLHNAITSLVEELEAADWYRQRADDTEDLREILLHNMREEAQDAAEAVANREEEFIYLGQPAFGLSGLLTIEGRHEVPGSDWSAPDRALQDVLAATTKLDDSGYRSPYALALSPVLYNNLFRLYPGTDVLALEHLRRLCTAGIYKPTIEGGVLVDTRVGVRILGQDLSAGYSSQDGVHYHLYLGESIVLRID